MHPEDSREASSGSDGGLGELLKLAGRRPMPDERYMIRARAAARVEWTRLVERRGWPLAWWMSAIAAVGVVALLASTWLRPGPSIAPAPAIEIATLQTIVGAITVTGGDGASTRATGLGARLRAGDRVETHADSRAVLVLDGGTAVKLDRNSRLALEPGVVLALERGALYLDADPNARDRDVVVRTPLAIVRHLGTQFEVRLDSGAVGVRVREGVIAMEAGAQRWVSHAGEELRLTPGLVVERRPIATYGPAWSWVIGLPQPFTLEGATVRDFLDWVSREQGWRWSYQEPAMRDRFDRTVLRGSIDGLTAEEALEAALRTCDLTFRLAGDRLVVTRR